jgi:esterase
MSYLKNFNYQLYGSKKSPKLVFLHGLMGMGANWRKILSAFQDNFEVLVYDQRGHGRSFQPESGYGPMDYAEDLNKIISELGWEKITLVGHSMGGRASIAFAMNYAEKLNKLVIEDIPPQSGWDGAEKIINLVESVPVPFNDRQQARNFFKTSFMQGTADAASQKRLADFFYLNMDENKSTGQMGWRFYKKAIVDSLNESRSISLWEGYKHICLPILLVRGEFSEDLTDENYEKMLSENPYTNGVVIKNSGHWVHAEQPKCFISVLKDFL